MSHKINVRFNDYDDEVFDKARRLPINDVTAAVLANRATKYGADPVAIFNASLKDLDNPATLPDIDKACDRIIKAMKNREIIALETDHDADGVTSHAVLKTAFIDYFGYPSECVQSFIGHRMKEGYGLSAPLSKRILEQENRPHLIITADNGSSDGERITLLSNEGIDTIVTDHHEMPKDGVPKDAVACVTPARTDSDFPDSMIAGVMVAFLLMCRLRQRLLDEQLIHADTPRLTNLLDYVALGTVADCVSLSQSLNNRALIKAGLNIINNDNSRECWHAVRHQGREVKEVTSQDLGFSIGPKINAAGRLDDAMIGVDFLLSKDRNRATDILKKLDAENLKRKEIEAKLKEEAFEVGELQVEMGNKCVIVLLTDGHAGVHGIVASRLVERFGRPAICFSDKQGSPGLISGSARGIEGFNVRGAMQYVSDKNPELLGPKSFGGHVGAGGLTINKDDFIEFCEVYQEATNAQLGDDLVLEPFIMSDGLLNTDLISIEMIRDLEKLEPYGRQFDAPVFTSNFRVLESRPLGKDVPTKHWSLGLMGAEGGMFKGVWFNYGPDSPVPTNGENYLVTYSPAINSWQGNESVQIMIKTIEKA